MEITTLLSLIWSFYPLFFYGDLSDDFLIPIHYNSLGEINGWGGRAYLWLLPLIAMVCYIGISITERYPEKYNYPVQVTEENSSSLYGLGVNMFRHMKFICITIFAYINNSSFSTAIGENVDKSNYVVTILLGILSITVLLYLFKMLKYKQ